MAFLKFAAAVRSTTTLMGMFTVVTSIGKRGLVGLAVAGALIATSFEDVERYLDSLMTSISNAMGPVGETVRKTLQGLGFDTRALNMELAGMVAFGSGIESKMGKSEKSLKAFGRSVRVLDGNLKELKDTTADQAMNSIEQSMSNLSGSLVQAAQGHDDVQGGVHVDDQLAYSGSHPALREPGLSVVPGDVCRRRRRSG